MAIAASGFQAVSSITGGISQNKASKAEADLQAQQGKIALDEAQTNATNEAYNQNQQIGQQRLAYLANGVSLEGSPSLVLAESKKYGQSQVDSILKSGAAKYNLAQQEAAITRNKGRAALIAGITEGVGTIGTAAGSAYKSGMFDPTKKINQQSVNKNEGIMG
jgi:hypothetical protein